MGKGVLQNCIRKAPIDLCESSHDDEEVLVAAELGPVLAA